MPYQSIKMASKIDIKSLINTILMLKAILIASSLKKNNNTNRFIIGSLIEILLSESEIKYNESKIKYNESKTNFKSLISIYLLDESLFGRIRQAP